jgi:RNA polymerase sigma-70 factor (ECF subfamily)
MSENEMTGNLFLFATAKAADAKISETKQAEIRLVERICAGDLAAFDELYKTFAPLVHGILLARAPREDVEDIMQEVFLSAYKNLHTLREKGAVGAWLVMIARNRAAEFYRSTKPTEELSENLQSRETQRNEAEEILTAIRALPETYKETLVLRLVEGMTGQEIAERTNLTPESVRVNLHRGMKLLRRKLGIEE